MRAFLENKVTMNILPTSGVVQYHQKTYSKINCNNHIEKQQLDKDLEVRIVEYTPMLFTVRIVTKNIKIQLDAILKKQEDLTKEIYRITEDVEFRMNYKGELLEITNHTDIINKWKELKLTLEKKYKGQAAERYLRGIDKKIANHDKLLSDCIQYRLYGLLFNDLYGEHFINSNEVRNRTRILDNTVYQLPLTINEKIALQREEEEGKKRLGISGLLNEEQLYDLKINNLFKRKNISAPNGLELKDYKGTYRYDEKTGIYDSITLDIVTAYGPDYKKTQNYQLIQKV